ATTRTPAGRLGSIPRGTARYAWTWSAHRTEGGTDEFVRARACAGDSDEPWRRGGAMAGVTPGALGGARAGVVGDRRGAVRSGWLRLLGGARPVRGGRRGGAEDQHPAPGGAVRGGGAGGVGRARRRAALACLGGWLYAAAGAVRAGHEPLVARRGGGECGGRHRPSAAVAGAAVRWGFRNG